MCQIEAADKKYKATCQFLEEQASEREQERDEAQREIAALKEQLREREKDRASCERVNNEVCSLFHRFILALLVLNKSSVDIALILFLHVVWCHLAGSGCWDLLCTRYLLYSE